MSYELRPCKYRDFLFTFEIVYISCFLIPKPYFSHPKTEQ